MIIRTRGSLCYPTGGDGLKRFDKYVEAVNAVDTIKHTGVVQRILGLSIESLGPYAKIGDVCRIYPSVPEQGVGILAEVIGFKGPVVQLMPYDSIEGIHPGAVVVSTGEPLSVGVSQHLLGRVLDGVGTPIDSLGAVEDVEMYPINNPPPDVLTRGRITDRITTGIKAIDAFLPVGKGQRFGIFSGSGVGKSTLLGMLAKNTSSEVNVIALIGERGREVLEFIQESLGEEGMARSVVVVSSSNTPPLARLRGAYVATAVAEYFRDRGMDVMLLFDSVTRLARAQREIGIAQGEPPASRGFPPSVFERLSQLLERCGTSYRGTITGFYTILVEGDDLDEPVSDNVRGILDGHIVLSRKLAQEGHYPAIDILSSLSRLETRIAPVELRRQTDHLRLLLSTYANAEDLISVGAYEEGSNPTLDEAVSKREELQRLLRQRTEEKIDFQELLTSISSLVEGREVAQ